MSRIFLEFMNGNTAKIGWALWLRPTLKIANKDPKLDYNKLKEQPYSRLWDSDLEDQNGFQLPLFFSKYGPS